MGSARGRRSPWHPLALTFALAFAAACDGAASRRAVPEVRTVEPSAAAPMWLALPNDPLSLKLAVIGDSGTGTPAQREVAKTMIAYRERFPFSHVLMLGDNIYEGPASRKDYQLKFEEPYAGLLADGVAFRAVLGNHDDPNQRSYAAFGMGGERYYTFQLPEGPLATLRPRAQFFALDSTRLDLTQRRWLARELARSDARWKIGLMHHPLYTSGRYHRYARIYRWALESLFVSHGVDVVFSGHEHIYERSTLQRGVQYFISGAAGSIRRGDARAVPHVARTFDDDCHFMLIEITRNRLHFQAISRTGRTIDAGVLERAEDPALPADVTTSDTAGQPRSRARGS